MNVLNTENELDIIEDVEQSKNEIDLPIKVADNTITSLDDIQAYAGTLTDGERQLLIVPTMKKLFLTDGNGSYEEVIEHDIDLSEYVERSELDNYVTKSDLDSINVSFKLKSLPIKKPKSKKVVK